MKRCRGADKSSSTANWLKGSMWAHQVSSNGYVIARESTKRGGGSLLPKSKGAIILMGSHNLHPVLWLSCSLSVLSELDPIDDLLFTAE